MKRRERDEDWSQRRIQSIEVGFQVIRAMEAADGPLPLRDVAAIAGMPPSKVHLYLVSFIREGLVRQDPHTGHYGLGSFAIQLGHSAIRQLDVVGLSRDELAALQEATGFATYLSVWGNRGPGIVSKVDGQRQGSLTVRLGYVLPLYASATGRVFLAYLNRSETAHLLAEELAAIRTGDESWPGATDLPEDPADIDAQMALIRQQGFATSRNNINANFAAMAAPIFDHTGRVIASVTVLGSEKGMSGAKAKSIAKLLLEANERLSARMGYNPREHDKAAAKSAAKP